MLRKTDLNIIQREVGIKLYWLPRTETRKSGAIVGKLSSNVLKIWLRAPPIWKQKIKLAEDKTTALSFTRSKVANSAGT